MVENSLVVGSTNSLSLGTMVRWLVAFGSRLKCILQTSEINRWIFLKRRRKIIPLLYNRKAYIRMVEHPK